MNEPTHLDLFSGIGGFSLAFEAEGFRTIGFSEIDPYASAVLKKHWPGVTNYGDVRNVPVLRCHALTGGPPCQPASTAGKRKGKEDDRWLWPEALRVVDRCRPAFCLFENPLGFVTLNGGLEFDQVLAELEAMGYEVPPPLIIPACAVDAAHPRLRVWITAHLNCVRCDGGRDSRNGIQKHNSRGEAFSTAASNTKRNDSPAQQQRHNQQPRTASDVDCEGLERSIGIEIAQAIHGNGTAAEKLRPVFDPALLRSVHGLSNRVDRIRCLGNAIVPQIAQIFARAIKAHLTRNENEY